MVGVPGHTHGDTLRTPAHASAVSASTAARRNRERKPRTLLAGAQTWLVWREYRGEVEAPGSPRSTAEFLATPGQLWKHPSAIRGDFVGANARRQARYTGAQCYLG